MQKRVRLFCVAAAALVVASIAGAQRMTADYQSERRIDLYNIHNGETLSVVYKKDGKYIPEALEKLNWFMRDWRKNEATKMDPAAIDIVWEIHQELGSKEPIHLVSAYRSPRTNESLRKAGGGQAKNSRHMVGKAIDVSFPDVPVQKIRYAALVREQGGVGYYPTSGVPFVHVDTGRVRMWPRMPRQELALLFPNGRSKYVPADGRPISPKDVKYAQAHYAQLAETIAAFHQFRAQAKDRTLVASLEAPAAQAGESQAAEGQAGESQPIKDAASDPDGEEAPAAAAPPQPVVADAGGGNDALAALIEANPTAPEDVSGPSEPAATASDAQPSLALAANDPDETPLLEGPALKPGSKTLSVPKTRLASLGDLIPPAPQLIGKLLGKKPAKPKALPIEATVKGETQANGDGSGEEIIPPVPTPVSASDVFLNQTGWVRAPGYDADHGDELSYRPFSLAGLITESASTDNPLLARLVRPDLAAAHGSIGAGDDVSLRFKPDIRVAELSWNAFAKGEDPVGTLLADAETRPLKTGRLVQTASR